MNRIAILPIAIFCLFFTIAGLLSYGCGETTAQASESKVPEKLRTSISSNVKETEKSIIITPFRYDDIEYLHIVDWYDDFGTVIINKAHYCKRDTIELGGRIWVAITKPPLNLLNQKERVPIVE